MKVGSLFSGIGGLDLGLERAGMTVRWQCEIDTAAQTVLRRHWPSVALYDDVNELGGECEPVDLICGGFPCQDLSVAGRRAGLAGERSGLFFQFMRVVAELSPDWILLENVPGLRSSWSPTIDPPSGIPSREERGRRVVLEEISDLHTVVSQLGKLGYGWAYRSFDAQFFNVAQRRERVFIVGCLGDAARAAQVLFEPESCAGDSPPSREAGKEVAALTSCGVGTCGADDNQAQAGHLIAHTLSSEGADASEDGTGSGTPIVAVAENQRGEVRTSDISPQLTCGGGKPGERYPCVAMTSELSPQEECCPTLKAEPAGLGYHANVGMTVRRLTPTECERLQSFPDGWTAEGILSVRPLGYTDEDSLRRLITWPEIPVEWKAAIGRLLTGSEAYASCTTSALPNTELQICRSETSSTSASVLSATNWWAMEREATALSTTSHGSGTETRSAQRPTARNGQREVSERTFAWLPTNSDGSCSPESSSITSTWMEETIVQLTSMFSPMAPVTCGRITRSTAWSSDSSKRALFALRMVNTANQSDSARYRQLGNAVCVNVAEWVGRRIMEVAE